MKKILIAGAVALFGTGALADPVHGMWQTIPDDNGNFGHIQVGPCGKDICGKLVKSFGPGGGEIQSDNNGKNIVWGMRNKGGGHYGGGKVWSPDRDKTYSSKMQLNGNSLKIKGCILGICRDGGVWKRVN